MGSQFLVTIFCTLIFINSARSILVENDQSFLLATPLTHSTYLDAEQKVLLQWGTASDRVIVLQMSAPARGYLGFGLSPNGGMPNSDILLMWVDDRDNTAHVEARYAVANAEPTLSASQASVLAYEGAQNATHTRVKVARTINAACTDPQGHRRNIEKSAMRIIYAYSDTDPDATTGHAMYHGPQNRGSITLYILDDVGGSYEMDKQEALRDTTKIWQFVERNYAMPANSTVYHNTFYQIPQISKDAQVLGFEPVLDPNNIRYVHHFIVRICDRDFIGTADNTQPFDAASYGPDSAKAQEKAAKCMQNLIWAWGVGGNAFYMPHDTALKWTARDSKRWIVVEIHYNNPDLISGLHDSSGIRILIRDDGQLRTIEAGITYVAVMAMPEQIIPSRQLKPFTNIGFCSQECTKKFVPANGSRMFGVILHAHMAAQSIAFRHFRNGKELAPIAADSTYNFNYQEWRPVNVTILPGDLLSIECNYTTPGRQMTTFGGEPTTAEMCMAFFFSTPPIPASSCASMMPRKTILDALLTKQEQQTMGFQLGPDAVPDFHRMVARNFTSMHLQVFVEQMMKMMNTFGNFNWTAKSTQALQNVYTDSKHSYHCANVDNINNFATGSHSPRDYNWTPYVPPAVDCNAGELSL